MGTEDKSKRQTSVEFPFIVSEGFRYHGPRAMAVRTMSYNFPVLIVLYYTLYFSP